MMFVNAIGLSLEASSLRGRCRARGTQIDRCAFMTSATTFETLAVHVEQSILPSSLKPRASVGSVRRRIRHYRGALCSTDREGLIER